MANWQHKINLSDLWKAAEPNGGTLTTQQLAAQVAERLEAQMLSVFQRRDRFELEEVIESFKALATDDGADFDDFDQVYSDLCDFADCNHRLWVKTF